LTKGKDLGVWQTQFRIQLESGGSNAARQTLEAMGKSELPEKVRFLAVAGGFLALRDFDQASVWLDMAKAANPADENVALTRATLARTTNDNDAMLAAYQEAYRLAPQREDIRRTLALALAANNLSDVPWDQIDELVGPDSKSVSPADQLYHALILINRGDAGQIEKAREILRGLMAGGEPATVADAARLLITIERKRWDAAIKDGDVAGGNEALTELRRLYDLLVTYVAPVAGDLYGYGELLLAADLLTEAEAISDRLAAIAPASRAALDLPLQLAKKTGGETEVQSIVDAWLARFDNKNAAAAVTSAAQSLATVGMMDQAVQMLAKAYEKTPSLLAVYVAALAQSGKPDLAAKTSFDHFGKYRTAESVILLADSIVQGALLSMVDDEVNQVLSDAVKEFPANIKLIESVGTLRLTLQQYGEAVELYRQSEKLNPVSLITLNNLAVALAEISGRAEEGLVRIERAVELYGRNPELLDTLGVVQLRANRLAEAETNLREAYTKSTNDRHLFHLIQVLDAAMKIEELQSMWKQLDLTKINAEQLSPIDQKQLEQLKQRLGTPSQT
jgi:tetratricopeptide (TPR) repeat protein